jgi:hypothetical protein
MMRLQYEEIIKKLYTLIDEELEMDTEEGASTYKAMTQALFNQYILTKFPIGPTTH